MAEQSRSEPRPRFLLKLSLMLRGILLRLADRVVPADTAMTERAAGMAHTQIAGVLARYRIPDFLQQGPMDAATLAEKTGTDADAMHRILRAASTSGVGAMLPDGRFCNNHLSLALCSDSPGRVREFALHFSSEANRAAYGELDRVLETGREAFSSANGMSQWQWFDQHPQERDVFAQMMAGMTRAQAPMIAKLYPFAEVQRLCDLGGGRGTLLSELVLRHPHLRGLLYECEGLLESAGELIRARGVEDRIETRAGDFFTSVPTGYDAYLLKNILHDWGDDHCKIILDNCHTAMAPGARLLLVETPVETNDRHNFASFLDLHVLTAFEGGRERGIEEYHALFKASGFTPGRVFRSPIISVLEAVR